MQTRKISKLKNQRLLITTFIFIFLLTITKVSLAEPIVAKEKYVVNTKKEAIEIIRRNLKNYQNEEYTITFKYQPVFKSAEILKEYVLDLMKEAETTLDDFEKLNIYERGYKTKSYHSKSKETIGLSEVVFNNTFKNTKSELDMIKKQIREKPTPKGTNYEKVKALYKTVLFSLDYNEISKGITDKDLLKELSLKERNLTIGLKKEAAVCETYSMYLSLLFSENGFENKIVKGTKNGILHVWNLVNINGSWYHLDATNSDISMETISNSIKKQYPVLSKKQHDINVAHNYQLNFFKYFLKSNNSMTKNDFIWNEKDYPIASKDYPYPDYK